MWILAMIGTALVLWGAWTVLRPGRARPPMSPDTARTRIEASMVTGRDWRRR
ncbi:hypothetical protein GCM10027601_02610 [Nocardioides ungokensis]